MLHDIESEKQFLEKKHQVNRARFKVLGAMLREAFEDSSVDNRAIAFKQLQTTYQISNSDKVGLISMGGMMGAQGERSITMYCKQLRDARENIGLKDEQTLHLFILCGRNSKLQKKILQNFPGDNKIKFHPLGWTEAMDIAAILSHTSFYITKPGGTSTSEAIALDAPLLFDTLSTQPSPWEPYNMKKAVELKAGQKINPNQFILQVRAMIRAPRRRTVANFPGRTFSANLVEHVNSQLAPAHDKAHKNDEATT